MKYLYLIGTVVFTAYCQLMLKWRVDVINSLPDQMTTKIQYFFKVFTDPYMITCYFAGMGALLFWMLTLTKFELSSAYTSFMSLSFMVVVLMSVLLFQEIISPLRFLGFAFMLSGIVLVANGA